MITKYEIFCITDFKMPFSITALEKSIFPICDTEQEAEEAMTDYALTNPDKRPYKWTVLKIYTNE